MFVEVREIISRPHDRLARRVPERRRTLEQVEAPQVGRDIVGVRERLDVHRVLV